MMFATKILKQAKKEYTGTSGYFNIRKKKNISHDKTTCCISALIYCINDSAVFFLYSICILCARLFFRFGSYRRFPLVR